jgi:hypothetical protein
MTDDEMGSGSDSEVGSGSYSYYYSSYNYRNSAKEMPHADRIMGYDIKYVEGGETTGKSM